jgi:putative ABC transport system permease protein
MLTATLKGMLSHKLRLFLTATSIALGVAFLAGTLMLTSSMQRAFDELFSDVNASSDTVVRARSGLEGTGVSDERPPVPASVLERVRDVDGVAVAEGTVQGYALLTGEDGKPIQPQGAPTLGASAPRDRALLGEITVRSGRLPTGPGEVAIDASSAEKGKLAVGETTQVIFQRGPEVLDVVGVVGFGDNDHLGGATTAYFDLATAQRLLEKEGVFDTISVQATKGVDDEKLTERVAAAVPADLQVLTGQAVADEQADAAKEGLEFLNVALLAFAGIALFVGSFIIWNTFSMQVAQRTRELALLRAIGATRRQVMRTLVTESVILGFLSSAAGVLLGVGLARGLVALMGGFGFTLPSAGIRLEAEPVLLGLVVGTVVTVVSALAPARRATRVLPIQALRASGPASFTASRSRIATGLAVVAAGAGLLAWSLFGGAPAALLAVGTIGIVLGVATLAPAFVRPMAAAIGAPLKVRGVPGELARENAMRNPRRTASTAMALVIGLTMVAAVAVFAASLKASFADVLTSTKADLYVLTPTSQSEGFSREVTEKVRAVEGVATVSPTAFGMAELDGLTQGYNSIDPATAEQVFDLGMVSGSVEALTSTGILVHEDAAERHGLHVGDTVPAVFSGTGSTEFEVAGIYADRGFVAVDYVISNEAHDAANPHRLEGTTMVLVEDGESVAAVQERIDVLLTGHPDATVMDAEEFRGALGGVVDQLLGLVTVLLLLAVLIALLGIVNTLALSVFERTRELGMLRAIGMTRGQVRAMVRWESVVISTIGAALGAVLGVGLGLALTRALAEQGLTELAVPGVQLGLYVVAAALAGVVAAIGPARRASRVDVLKAVAAE